jgi:serine protease Do
MNAVSQIGGYMSKKKIFLVVVLVSCMVAGGYFSCTRSEVDTVFGEQQDSPLKNDSSAQPAWQIQQTFRKIFEIYKDRVVYISTEQTVRLPYNPFSEMFGIPRQQTRTGLGSGFILSEDGFICTNFHVIAPNGTVVEKVMVIAEGENYQAEVRGFDEYNDIALLKINPRGKLKPVYIGDSSEVEVGDWAIAVGNPFGLANSFTVGVISATGRTNIDGDDNVPYFQTDVAINPGNSGGPLINIKGEVIGINRMIYSKSGGYMGIGFAIPMNEVRDRLETLKQQHFIQKGYIGVTLWPMNEMLARQLGWNSRYGAVVNQPMPGGPAQQAGIQQGDVIIAINGKEIRSVHDLVREIEKISAGSLVELTIWRRGATMKVQLKTAAKPSM